jgi:hypothetical protein
VTSSCWAGLARLLAWPAPSPVGAGTAVFLVPVGAGTPVFLVATGTLTLGEAEDIWLRCFCYTDINTDINTGINKMDRFLNTDIDKMDEFLVVIMGDRVRGKERTSLWF